jgi:hypothetical protein
MTAEQLAELFHTTYERLAPEHGYETRKESAKPWADVPEQNKGLMIAVAGEILQTLQVDDLRALIRMYDAFCTEKCPYSYCDGWRAKPLRDEKKRLLGENN